MNAGPLDVGIDLGTSNCALAYYQEDYPHIQQLAVEQLESPGHIFKRSTLPSAIYLPSEDEISPEDRQLSWPSSEQLSGILGAYAFQHGSLNPERLISSAKSWLCFGQTHRDEAILPWGAGAGIPKMSPVQASAAFLKHLRQALAETTQQQDWPGSGHTVVTVPASFDEIARQLTVQAVQEAELGECTLLEEPLAAFYAWIAQDEKHWREQVEAGDLVLVCDVGGGTCDFSLIAVGDEDGQLQLERIAVGKHLLLGGDNMDLALAYHLQEELKAEGHELDHWQLLSLKLNCRQAKELLLAEPDRPEVALSIASRGSSLFASSISCKLTQELIDRVILEGFFPNTQADEYPMAESSVGLREFGLPYVNDPAISRHLALFLHQAFNNVEQDERLKDLLTTAHMDQELQFMRPTKVLFNGGVFQSQVLRSRVLDVLQSWLEETCHELTGGDFDLAVSRGAAYYARNKRLNQGLRIRSGTSRSYYLGIESGMMAIPGFRPPIKGLCVVPQGTEEGQSLSVEDREFALITGQEAQFQLFSSRLRAGDQVGSIVENAEKELEATARLTITLPADKDHQLGERVPVQLDAEVTETGTMSLFMKHLASEQKWQLEFDLRSYE
ncbi:MAG: Hsp70 family protein [Oligoflexus sp.]